MRVLIAAGLCWLFTSSQPARAGLIAPFEIVDPSGEDEEYFGNAVAALGDDLIVGSAYGRIVYVIDGQTGAPVLTIPAPSPNDVLFGEAVTAVGDKIFATDAFDRAYLFDVSGTLVNTTTVPGSHGYAVRTIGSDVLMGVGNGQWVVHRFDPSTGAVVHTFTDPNPGAGTFGQWLTVTGADLLTSSATPAGVGVAYLFDATSGSLLQTFLDPAPTPADSFGVALAGDATRVFVGAPGATGGGAVHVFDRSSGVLVKTLSSPSATTFERFGYTLVPLDGALLVGAPGHGWDGTDSPGAIYQVDVTTGATLATLSSPATSGQLGYAVTTIGDDVVSGAAYSDVTGEDAGLVYYFPACGNGIVSAGEECDDGNTTSGDGCSSECIVELCGPTPDSSCRKPSSRKSVLKVRHVSTDGSDTLSWKWASGSATVVADFGAPATLTSYALCIYDHADSTPELTLAVRLPRGGLCDGRACWAALGSRGFKYADRLATPSGLSTVRLQTTSAGGAKITIKGKGANLGLPAPALVPGVTVQLKRLGATTCWDANYSAPSVVTTERFVGKSD